MKVLTDVLATLGGSRTERLAAQVAFLKVRAIRRRSTAYCNKVFRYIDNEKWKSEIEAGVGQFRR